MAHRAASRHRHFVIDSDFTDRLPRIHTPTLVIVGARDVTVPPSVGELAAREIPDARFKMRGVGHQPVGERPEEFDHLVQGFLGEHIGDCLGR